MQVGNIELGQKYETKYMCDKDVDTSEFTNDITRALKFAQRSGALSAKHDYEMWKNHGHETDWRIIPMKITYEW